MKLYDMSMASIYAAYLKKVERKNQSKEDLDTIIRWLTGYQQEEITALYENKTAITVKQFFDHTPFINENAHFITGKICGYRIEEIEDMTMKKIRQLDKLVDELAKGRSMEKILRK